MLPLWTIDSFNIILFFTIVSQKPHFKHPIKKNILLIEMITNWIHLCTSWIESSDVKQTMIDEEKYALTDFWYHFFKLRYQQYK